MNPSSLAHNQNIEGLNKALVEKLNSLRQLPKELFGKIPESVWASLTADHRAEILKQYGLYEKYLQGEIRDRKEELLQNTHDQNTLSSTEIPLDQLVNNPNQSSSANAQNNTYATQQNQQKPSVIDITKVEKIKEKAEFAQAVIQKERAENQNMQQEAKRNTQEKHEVKENVPEISNSESKRMQMENPQVAIDNRKMQPAERVLPTFFGYPVSEDVSNNVDEIEENGSPRDGRTWSASFIKKFLAIFTN